MKTTLTVLAALFVFGAIYASEQSDYRAELESQAAYDGGR